MTINDFEVAAGGVRGRDHARAERPSQDAWCVERTDACLVAVVADGCGSARHSEVGARVGARLWASSVARAVARGRSPAEPSLWARVSCEVLRHLAILSRGMGGDRVEVVSEHMLFTLVGAVLTGSTTVIFSIGDGVYALGGEATELGPFPCNAPPYLGHALLPGGTPPPVVLHAIVPTPSVRTLLVGTDGAVPLAGALGGFDELFTTDLYYDNRDALRRRLHCLAEGKRRIDWSARRVISQPGVLPDDATVVVLRRRERDR